MSQSRRRQFLIASGALFAAPLAFAQEAGRTYRVGALFVGGSAATERYRLALREQLATHGFVEGRNLRINLRGALGLFQEDRGLARELLAVKPDALFTGGAGATRAARATTKTVPIVFVWVTDPVEQGFVKSHARPGGNVTGATSRFGELLIKRMELARALIPKAKRIAVVNTGWTLQAYESVAPMARKAAAQMGVELVESGNSLIDGAIVQAARDGAEVILPFGALGDSPIAGEQVVRVANKLGIPAIFADAEMTERGGLISLGTNLVDDVRRGADQLAHVLKGAKPAELPVDQGARFEMAVNLKTAKALGIKVPQSVLLRADRVIE